MKRILKILLILFVVVGLFYTLFYLYKKSQKKPVVYSTETAHYTDITKKTVATGSVVPRNEIEIKPQLSGIVDKIFVEAGQSVKKGDLIARIRVIPNMSSLNAAENRVNRAKISLKNAQQDFDRNKPLFEEGVISASEFQRFNIALQNAREEVSASTDNLRIVRDGVSSSRSGTNTLVKSTIEGMVLDVPIEVGNSVIEANTFNAGTTIAFVADMNEMIFEGNVDESEVGKLKLGMDLILTLGAIEDEEVNAKLEYIAPKGKEDQGAIQFEIKAALQQKEDVFIRAGYSANADIVLDKRDSVLALSEGLVSYQDGKPYIEVETSAQVFEQRDVQLGLSDGINVEVLGGVTIDDKLKSKVIEDKTDQK